MQFDWTLTPLVFTGVASAVAALGSLLASWKSAQNSARAVLISERMERLAAANIHLAQHKLLFEMMQQWATLAQKPHYRPAWQLLEGDSKIGSLLLSDAGSASVTANKRAYVRGILASVRPESTWLTQSNGKATLTGPDFDAVRKAINDICNALEIISGPYRLGLVDKAEYLKEFRNALCPDGKASFFTYTAKATYFESIKEVQKDALRS